MKLLYIVEHPIQYQAPLLRRITAELGVEFTVLFRNLGSADGAFDQGFGQPVTWDTPLLEGYQYKVTDILSDAKEMIRATDIVWFHGWQGRRMRRLLDYAHRLGKPVLMRGENTLKAMPPPNWPLSWLKARYLDWIFSRCSLFLTVGQDNAAYYANYGVPEDRMVLVPYAVDNTFFQDAGQTASLSRRDLRRQLGLAPHRPVILFAGKMQKRKHPDILLEAFNRSLARINEQGLRPYLLFVGDGEMSDDLRTRAAENPDVIFTGFKNQSELPAFYDLADIFVLASSREPWGLAVNEAMNAGCAVIVSDECGCAADLVCSNTGIIVQPGDPDALTSAICNLLSSPEGLAAKQASAKQKVSNWGFGEDLIGLRTALSKIQPFKDHDFRAAARV